MKNNSLWSFALALAMLLGCLSGCAKTEVQPEASPAASSAVQAVSSAPAEEPAESVSAPSASQAEAPAAAEAVQLERQELDAQTAALLDGEDHDFEREIAYRYYHNGEAKTELADTERNQWMSGAEWGFDENGSGVFAVALEGSMSKSWNFIEYTTDFGETWSSAGVYGIVTQIEDIQVAGNRVVLAVGNGVSLSRHSLVYSDDLCQSFYERDTIDFAPSPLTAVLEEDGSNVGMDLLSIDSDGSVVLGWSLRTPVNVSEFEDFNNGKQNYFLIGKTDAALSRCEVLYADGNR